MKMLFSGVAIAALVLSNSVFAADTENPGSRYLRCDGRPNNMTEGESFARLVGAITLLGIFAKQPENPDPSKRQFGEAGVAVCSELIDGPEGEGNAIRRLPLILARALHQIEAKNYEAAIADVQKAREEAAALGLTDNPYFQRSMGLSFGNIEAEARLRLGDPAGAQAASLAQMEGLEFSAYPVLISNNYWNYIRDSSPAGERNALAQSRFLPAQLNNYAQALEEAGRFAEAATKREALITTIEGTKPDNASSSLYAVAALSHALAGNWEQATQRADFARSNLADRRARGVPEENSTRAVELLDMFDILRLANSGDLTTARRNFAARSQWVEASLGVVMEANRRLREGAMPEELTGALVKNPDELWQERYDAFIAAKLQTDTDNKTLFRLIWPYAEITEFEGRSKNTWRTTKSKMMSDEADEETGLWNVFAYGNPQTSLDSITLHAALQAKARNKEGFTMVLNLSGGRDPYLGPITIGFVRFADRSEVGDEADRFMLADAVIDELSQVIPPPEEVKAQREQRRLSKM